MIFHRSIPEYHYRDYTRYRKLLRSDFQFRCAYCLTLETHIGGEANFTIDHYRPRRGRFARPDLEAVYSNLYWICRECNENKGDDWTTPEQEAAGIRWLDPCEEWGDHDLHWQISPDGTIRWLTPIGEYTGVKLMLHRRPWLKHHWQQLHQWQQECEELQQLLQHKEIPSELAARVQTQLDFLTQQLEPPVFDRPRRTDQN